MSLLKCKLAIMSSLASVACAFLHISQTSYLLRIWIDTCVYSNPGTHEKIHICILAETSVQTCLSLLVGLLVKPVLTVFF